jgi:hypothetical protein
VFSGIYLEQVNTADTNPVPSQPSMYDTGSPEKKKPMKAALLTNATDIEENRQGEDTGDFRNHIIHSCTYLCIWV